MIWTNEIIQQVWNKAKKVEGFDETKYRKDACDAWIMRDKYGVNHNFGWVIDHIFPVNKGGNDRMENIRALQYQNKTSKADDYPSYKAAVTSNGSQNVPTTKIMTVNEQTQTLLKKLFNL